MSDDAVLAEQIAYYRRRASEYDETAYGDVDLVRPRVSRLVDQMSVSGQVLEIACGTGVWTEQLAERAEHLTALDAAPETIAIARERVTAPNVTFTVANIFGWASATAYDVVFFSAWLSHVPAGRFAQFWSKVGGMLAPGGRVLFIDEHVDEQGKEAFVAGRDEIVERTLLDGSTARIVKVFVEPEGLRRRLADLGWDCAITRDGEDWILGEARFR